MPIKKLGHEYIEQVLREEDRKDRGQEDFGITLLKVMFLSLASCFACALGIWALSGCSTEIAVLAACAFNTSGVLLYHICREDDNGHG